MEFRRWAVTQNRQEVPWHFITEIIGVAADVYPRVGWLLVIADGVNVGIRRRQFTLELVQIVTQALEVHLPLASQKALDLLFVITKNAAVEFVRVADALVGEEIAP